MSLESLVRMDQTERKKEHKMNLLSILGFNVIMYVIEFIFIACTLVKSFDREFTIRYSKAGIELFIAIWTLLAGCILIRIVHRLFTLVPKILIFWLIVGVLSAILQSIQQLLLNILDDKSPDLNIILIFVSYNLYDICPALVFINSFKVYLEFFESSNEDFEYDNSMIKFSDALNTY
ncbi:hypothetical protein SteCoe_32952 [Stentor coeruleus]|uniref:Uncharacterized protein n=1 Tax=Stentor coeruleus TaxID=5963 RepID=A0A1R2AXV6_9CILI|nr:hypothetical protein SteCoe_32952 [Stentor coeruleus]